MIASLTLLLVCGVQDPGAASSQPTRPAVKQLSDGEARVVLATFKKATKSKKASLRDRLQALDELGKASHEKLVPALEKVVAKGTAISVRRKAAKLLVNQPADASRKAVIKLLKDRAVASKPEVVADLIHTLDQNGYDPKDWKIVEKHFGDDYAQQNRTKQQAVLRLIKNQREIQGLRILLDNLDEPGQVADVDAADNPPAEYWEARWKAWRSWRDEVKGALFEITGQTFNSSAEASAWIRKNRKTIEKRRKR